MLKNLYINKSSIYHVSFMSQSRITVSRILNNLNWLTHHIWLTSKLQITFKLFKLLLFSNYICQVKLDIF